MVTKTVHYLDMGCSSKEEMEALLDLMETVVDYSTDGENTLVTYNTDDGHLVDLDWEEALQAYAAMERQFSFQGQKYCLRNINGEPCVYGAQVGISNAQVVSDIGNWWAGDPEDIEGFLEVLENAY